MVSSIENFLYDQEISWIILPYNFYELYAVIITDFSILLSSAFWLQASMVAENVAKSIANIQLAKDSKSFKKEEVEESPNWKGKWRWEWQATRVCSG